MKIIPGLRIHHYVERVSIFLILVALIVGMVGCGQPDPSYTLTISSTDGGNVPTPGVGTFTYYAQGVIVLVVALVAEADEGYRFVNWTGDVGTIGNVSAASTNITVQGDYSITANFVKVYNLTISSTAGGNVTKPGEGTYNYDEGTVVDLVAAAEEGYIFVNWTGDVGDVAHAEDATTNITMNGNYAITANFALPVWDWYDLDAIRDNLSGSYLLMNDLDSTTAGYEELASPTANGGKGWQPIGTFGGTFDGQGYEIRDLVINRPNEVPIGLFGSVSAGGVVRNVGVINIDVSGWNYVGGLVGLNNHGQVLDSYSSGNVTGEWGVGGLVGRNDGGQVLDSYSTGSVISKLYFGGLVGQNVGGGTVSNSYSISSVTGGANTGTVGGLVGLNDGGQVLDSYSTGNVTGSSYVGGLMGDNRGTVSGSYSTGSVTGSGYVGGLVGYNDNGQVVDSYSTGNVTGSSFVGGLVGRNVGGTVSNSFWDTQTSGQGSSAGGTPKNTEQMKDIDTFTAYWDIVAVGDIGERDTGHTWNIVDDVTYPFLSWQP
jgi:hypothetical protein